MMKRLTLLALVAAFIVGCGQKSEEKAEEKAGQATGQAQSEKVDDESDQLFAQDGDYSGRHILISYQGARNAKPEITRTKEEAMELAKEILAQVQAAPDTFAQVAQEKSEGPSAPRGGSLGVWKKGQMVPEFDQAVGVLEEGGISEAPVETAFGYHIIKREPIKSEKYFGGRAFVIPYKGAAQVPPTITREKAEAEQLAAEIGEKLNKDNFEEIAAQYAELGPSPMPLPSFSENDPQMPPQFLESLKNIKYGEVAGPIELPIGFAFLQRQKVEKFAGSHILIAYKGAQNSRAERTKDEALAMAKDILTQLEQDPSAFPEIAQEKSEGPSAPRGGSLGSWFRGAMVPEFDNAISKLEPGEFTKEPVESPFGYHIILREKLNK